MLTKVTVEKHSCDGSGRKRKLRIEAGIWHKSSLNASFGKQPHWYLIAIDPLGTIIARASIYEDRNPSRCLLNGKRLYRWDIFNLHGSVSFAHGECVSLAGAKIVAKTIAVMAANIDPYNEQDHRR